LEKNYYFKDVKLIKAKKKSSADSEMLLGYILLELKARKTNSSDEFIIDINPIQAKTKDEIIIDGALSEAKTTNRFAVILDQTTGNARLQAGSKMMLSENLRGSGIGSYAFSEIISWLKSNYPEAGMDDVIFYFHDVRNKNERERLLNFYEKFGFEFNFNEDSLNEGILSCEGVGSLKTYVKPDKIKELDIAAFIGSVLHDRISLENEIKRMEDTVSKANQYMGKYNKDAALSFFMGLSGFLILVLIYLFLEN